MRHVPIPAVLLATLLAAPLAAQVTGGVRPPPRVTAIDGRGGLVVQPQNLQALQTRLDGFAASLPAEERALWDRLLLRAAAAGGASGEVRVTRILEIGPGGGCEIGPSGGCEVGPGGGCGDPDVHGAPSRRVAIIVQGGRAAEAEAIVVQGGRTPSAGIVVQGGRTPGQVNGGATPGVRPAAPGDVRRPTDAVSIGPKQEDPARPAPESLGRRLTEFSAQLPAEERGALEWLLTRAAAVPEARPATPGGLPPGAAVAAAPDGRPTAGGTPPGTTVAAPPAVQPGPGGLPALTLRQALGIDAVSIGPKQEDPARGPPRPGARWILRY